jgi:membrane dipeptidase
MKSFPNILFAMLLIVTISSCNTSDDEKTLAKARRIHSQILTIDTHTDTPLMFQREGFDFSGLDTKSKGKIDLRKMEIGGLDAVFLAVFIGQDERTEAKYDEVYARAMDIFQALHTTISEHAEKAAIALTSDDAYKIKEAGKKAIYIGVENGYPIGKNLSILSEFYDMGARYLTLCHTRNNDICDSSTDPSGPEHGGLSDFGLQVIDELNRLGILVDVSHISDDAFFQALEVSKVPIFASHSNTRAICDNPRNLTDEMIIKLAEKGGVVQLSLLSSYVKTTEPNPARDSAHNELLKKYNNYQNLSPEIRKKAIEEWYAVDDIFPQIFANVSDLVDHIDHIVKIVGIDYVGIGSDFDGGGALEGCMDASQMINITVELLIRGYSKREIEKIWGKNFIRVFKQAEEYSKSLK